MSDEATYPKWARPGGIKITDWTALAAFVISIVGLSWAYIAERLPPSVDIQAPETIQIECSDYDFEVWTCPDAANFEVLVDLFSVWNNSEISTKTGILELISGSASFQKGQAVVFRLPLDWKYFTDITDTSAEKKNTGRLPIPRGVVENLETEFVVNRDAIVATDEPKIKWSYFVQKVIGGEIDSVQFQFELKFAHGKEHVFKCLFLIDERMKSGLVSRGLELHNFPRDVACD